MAVTRFLFGGLGLSLDADRSEQKGRKMAVPVMNGRLGMNGRLDMSSSLGRTAGAGLVEPRYSGGRLTPRRLALGFGFGPRPPSAAIALLTQRGGVLLRLPGRGGLSGR